ncbi:LSU ribosomal protein L24P [Frankineae bacterium MT45]|nr:LSU ribosomal protein L24P [Frankineae bacterium MT45]
MKIKKGDTVVVIAGKDRGVKGKVLAANPETGKVIVEGVNRIKKHVAMSTTARGAKTGGIETIEAAIAASKVMVVDGDGNATRVGYRRDEDGRNVRVSRRSGKDLK